MMQRIENLNPYYIIFFVFLFYIFFPNNYSYWDAYYYAGQVKYEIDLFESHHLLYSPLIYVVYKFLGIFSVQPDALLLGKYLNSIFQLFNLLIFLRILKSLKVNSKILNWWLLFAGFSFNLWRFGTENETYIMPVTFSLLGSLYFIKYLHDNKLNFVLLSSFFAAVGCLFHQIHFFWWLGLMFGFFAVHKSFKTLILYTVPAWIVPVGYVLAIIFYEKLPLNLENLLHFVLRDFYRGSVIAEFGLKTIFLSVVSLVRTFIQVHPTILAVLQKNYLFFIPLILGFIIGIRLIISLFKKEKIINKSPNSNKLFGFTHLFILAGHLSAAVYNVGNVEFMVMVPYLTAIIILSFYVISKGFLRNSVLFLFVWNFSFGILPYHLYPFYDDDQFVEFIAKNPDEIYVVKSRIIQTKHFYETGKRDVGYIKLMENLQPGELDSLVKANRYVITDAIDYPTVFNKEKLLNQNNPQKELDQFHKSKLFDFGGLLGKTTIYKISKKP